MEIEAPIRSISVDSSFSDEFCNLYKIPLDELNIKKKDEEEGVLNEDEIIEIYESSNERMKQQKYILQNIIAEFNKQIKVFQIKIKNIRRKYVYKHLPLHRLSHTNKFVVKINCLPSWWKKGDVYDFLRDYDCPVSYDNIHLSDKCEAGNIKVYYATQREAEIVCAAINGVRLYKGTVEASWKAASNGPSINVSNSTRKRRSPSMPPSTSRAHQIEGDEEADEKRRQQDAIRVHNEGRCVPCSRMMRGMECFNRPSCSSCHHAEHDPKFNKVTKFDELLRAAMKSNLSAPTYKSIEGDLPVNTSPATSICKPTNEGDNNEETEGDTKRTISGLFDSYEEQQKYALERHKKGWCSPCKLYFATNADCKNAAKNESCLWCHHEDHRSSMPAVVPIVTIAAKKTKLKHDSNIGAEGCSESETNNQVKAAVTKGNLNGKRMLNYREQLSPPQFDQMSLRQTINTIRSRPPHTISSTGAAVLRPVLSPPSSVVHQKPFHIPATLLPPQATEAVVRGDSSPPFTPFNAAHTYPPFNPNRPTVGLQDRRWPSQLLRGDSTLPPNDKWYPLRPSKQSPIHPMRPLHSFNTHFKPTPSYPPPHPRHMHINTRRPPLLRNAVQRPPMKLTHAGRHPAWRPKGSSR